MTWGMQELDRRQHWAQGGGDNLKPALFSPQEAISILYSGKN
ncbi:MAG: hypothetical protein AAFQ36_02145 [Pseudomonadota bacterium]